MLFVQNCCIHAVGGGQLLLFLFIFMVKYVYSLIVKNRFEVCNKMSNDLFCQSLNFLKSKVDCKKT